MIDDPVLPTGEEEEQQLFETPPDWADMWQGMPSYEHRDEMPEQSLIVHFRNQADRKAFSDLVGQHLHAKTKFIWYPKAEIRKASTQVYTRGEKITPKYPVYIISKGRWDSRLTQRCLEWIQVPYHIVVEPQEVENYAAAGVPREKIFTLPFSNLGQGGIPARNWVWDHAVSIGAERHWILDDNIDGFARFHDNIKIEVDNGATFKAIEDFVDRYENVGMAGFNYDYFAPRKQGAKIKPITLNTRIYSGILIKCDAPYRWRGRYNEDTDLSLRMLKDGWTTVLFNAFLMYKRPTLTMKGGNATELYQGVNATRDLWLAHVKECREGCQAEVSPLTCQAGRDILSKDGRWLMAESLREQHPDCTTVEWKWDRWQHQVNYQAFKNNEFKLRLDAVVPAEANDYGLSLDAMPNDEKYQTIPRPQQPRREEPSVAPPAVSVLDFVLSQAGARPAASSTVSPVAAVSSPLEASPEIPPAAPESLATEPAKAEGIDPAREFRDALLARGHRVLTRDGKLFVTRASELTDADRATWKQLREQMFALAEPWKEPYVSHSPDGDGQTDSARIAQTQSTGITQQPQDLQLASSQALPSSEVQGAWSEQADSLLSIGKPAQTLAEFLGTAPPRIDVNWTPDEPPDLTGITDVVLNFATDGLEWWNGKRPGGVTVSTLDGQLTRFLPFRFMHGGNLDEAQVKRWAQEQLKGKRLHGSNIRFEAHHAREWGIDLEAQGCTFTDVQHTAALLDDLRRKFAIDELAKTYLPGEPVVERVDESRHLEHHASEVTAREHYTVRLTAALDRVMQPEIDKQDLRRVHDLEDAVIPVVVEMEKNAAPIDVPLLKQWRAELKAKIDEGLNRIAREVGFSVNPDSNEDMQRLFRHFNIPFGGETESGKPSFTDKILKGIDNEHVQLTRQVGKLLSLCAKFIVPYDDSIGSDGLLRFQLHQLRVDDKGTVRGRFAASEKNIQQVMNHDTHIESFDTEDYFVRRLFVPGSGLIAAFDAMQIEFRIFASHANSRMLNEAYAKDPLVSFHRVVEQMVKPFKSDLPYTKVKSLNFLSIYGGGKGKAAAFLELPRAESDKFVDIYHQAFPEVKALLRRAEQLALERGYVKSVLGRRARFPDPKFAYKALNAVIQPTAADIFKQKIVEVHAERHRTGFVMRMPVHDELVGDVPDVESMRMVAEILNRQSFPQLKVPILWSGNAGHNWAECK